MSQAAKRCWKLFGASSSAALDDDVCSAFIVVATGGSLSIVCCLPLISLGKYKGEASLGFDKTINNGEDLLRVRHEMMFYYAPNEGSFVWRARSIGARPYRSI